MPAPVQGLQLDVVSALVADETDKPLAARQVGLALPVTRGDLRSVCRQIALELGRRLPRPDHVPGAVDMARDAVCLPKEESFVGCRSSLRGHLADRGGKG